MSATRSKQHRVNGDTTVGQHVADLQKAKDEILHWCDDVEAMVVAIRQRLEEIV